MEAQKQGWYASCELPASLHVDDGISAKPKHKFRYSKLTLLHKVSKKEVKKVFKNALKLWVQRKYSVKLLVETAWKWQAVKSEIYKAMSYTQRHLSYHFIF